MRSVGAYVGVAAAAALAGVCLAGGPLYVSSAASEAVQVGLARTCLTDAGLIVRLGRSPGAAEETLIDEAATVAHGQPAIVTETLAEGRRDAGPDAADSLGAARSNVSVRRARCSALAAGEALSPDWASVELIWGLAPGVHLGGEPFVLTIATSTRHPCNPEPSYWCGLRTLLRPSTFGDPPPPMLLVDPRHSAAS